MLLLGSIVLWLLLPTALCSYFTIGFYATTSDVAIYSTTGSTLATFTPVTGVATGAWVGPTSGFSNVMFCQDTSSTQTTTSRVYLFAWSETGYVKTIKLQFTLTSGIIYWKAINVRYYQNTAYGSTCTDIVGTAYPNGGTDSPLATCLSCSGYGIGSFTFDVSNSPTSQPSRQPTSRPTSPTGRPSRQPTSQPSRQPSSQPSRRPSSQPTSQPSRQPSSQPSFQPTSRPSNDVGGSTNTFSGFGTASNVAIYYNPSISMDQFIPISGTVGGAYVSGAANPVMCQDTNSIQNTTSRAYIYSFTDTGYQKFIRLQFTLVSGTIYWKYTDARYVVYTGNTCAIINAAYPTASANIIASCSSCNGYSISSLVYYATNYPTSQPSRQPTRQPTSRPSCPTGQPSSQPSLQPTNRPSYHQGGASFSFVDYVTTSDVAIYYNSEVTTLSLFTPVTGFPSGNNVGAACTNMMFCQDTSQTQTSTSQIYIFSFIDGTQMKFIRVVYTLASGTVYWRATEAWYLGDTSQGTSTCTNALIAFASATSIGSQIASCAGCPAYGVKSLVFTVSMSPSVLPTIQPTGAPTTRQPTVAPSTAPTLVPSQAPTMSPSVSPSVVPSTAPTTAPSIAPSVLPSVQPSVMPTVQPSITPSVAPSVNPSIRPTLQPSVIPTLQPSVDINTAVVSDSMASSPAFKVRNAYAFAAFNGSGHVFTWGSASRGGDSSSVYQYFKNVTAIVSARSAFAALNSDGSVVAWGDATSVAGSSVYRSYTSIVSVYATEAAFALLSRDGAVYSFGSSFQGGNMQSVSTTLSSGVIGVVANAGAFAAWKSDGSVYCWGSEFTGGGVSSLTLSSLVNVVSVYATRSAFAARLADHSIVTWGDKTGGGVSSVSSSYFGSGAIHIVGATNVFAAVRADTSLVSWGIASSGGNSEVVDVGAVTNAYVAHTDFAVAVLKSDGSVFAWGDSGKGGSTAGVSLNSIAKIYSTKEAFAALSTSGAVTAWGSTSYGGSTSSVASDLMSGVASIASTNYAFAGLKSDGSVVVWGDEKYGGSVSTAVSLLLKEVVKICSNELAFSAITSDGSVIVWGHPHSVGSSGGGLLLKDADYSSIGKC